jgi:hypothetical protein
VLGERLGDRNMLQSAKQAFEASRDVYRSAGSDHADYLSERIAQIEALLVNAN